MGNSNSSVHPLVWAVFDGDVARLQKLMSETEKWAKVKDKTGSGLLHYAAWKNRVEIAEYLTANGINIELRNNSGATPFLFACFYGNAAIVDLLISKKCNRLAENASGKGALALAVIAGQLEMTKKLVEMGFDVNKPCNKHGLTSLHLAAANGSVQIVTFLIDSGANLEAKTKLGSTPILIAVMKNKVKVFELLISRGSNVLTKEKNGFGLLHVAAQENCLTIAKYLISNGANIELRNNLGETPFLVACRFGSSALVDLLMSKRCNHLAETTLGRGALALAVIARQFEMTKKLVKMGFDVNKPCDKEGCTSLHWAAAQGSAKIITFLIDKGAHLETKTKLGSTPIMIAVKSNKVESLDLLTLKGCDVRTMYKDGNGLLHCAAVNNCVKVAEYLIANGANIELRTKLGETPFLAACKHGRVALAELLLSKGCDRLAETKSGKGALALAIIFRKFEMTKKLVEMEFNINKPSEKEGFTSLHWAVTTGSVQIVNFLIGSGANLEAKTKWGYTALVIAVRSNKVDLLDLLISKGFDLQEKDLLGNGLLHLAAMANCEKTAECLIAHGMDIELQNNRGATPFIVASLCGSVAVVDLLISRKCNSLTKVRGLARGALMLAVRNKRFEVTKRLVEMGFDINICDEIGWTSLHLAVSGGCIQIVNFLIDSGANLETRTKSGETPILLAVRYGKVDIFDLLISKGCNVRKKDECGHGLLVAAVWGEKVDLFKKVLKMGFDVNETCNNGRTCLHWAAANDSASIAEMLLDHGADLEPRTKNGRTCFYWGAKYYTRIAKIVINRADLEGRAKRGRTPFLVAVDNGSNNVASLLTAKGCDIHAKDEAGHGAFVLACTNHQYDMIPFLLSKFDYLNKEGAPMLHWAARNDYQRMAALLISHGADSEAKDEWGCTPFLTAVEFGSDNTIDLLISKKCNVFATTLDGASALDLAIMGGRVDLFRRFVIAGVTTDYLTQETRDFLSKLVADGNEEASKYLKEVEAHLHVLREELDVVLSDPESKRDDLRENLSRALEPETNTDAAVDGGRVVETAPESLPRAQSAFAVSACTESSCIVQ